MGSEVGDNAETDMFGVLADALRECVDAFLDDQRRHTTFLAGSAAASESATETLRGRWGSYPDRDAYYLALMLAIGAADHLMSITMLLAGERKSIFGVPPLARVAMEAAARSSWLLDPNVTATERVQRSMNERLTSISHAKRLYKTTGADVSDLERQASDILGEAANREWQIVKSKGQWPVKYIRAVPPASMRLIDETLGGTGLGILTYQAHSAAIHSQVHGLMEQFAQDGEVARPQITVKQVGAYVTPAIFVFQEMGRRLYRMCGWEPTAWQTATDLAVDLYSEAARLAD